jgi:AcrR family transcriptional regulator
MNQRRAAGSADSQVKECLVEAAQALIAEGGVEALTSRAITGRAGQNLGSITYYFGSKEALVTEAMARTARQLVAPVLNVLTDPHPDPVARLVDAV